MNLRAVVVDDSIIFRKVVRQSLEDIGGVDVVGVARDGQGAVEKINQFNPDVVTLDVEMPNMNGLEVLEELKRQGVDTKVIMVSSHTERGARTTTRALEIGAFDFITKPQHNDIQANIDELRRQLDSRIKAIASSLSHNPSHQVAVRRPMSAANQLAARPESGKKGHEIGAPPVPSRRHVAVPRPSAIPEVVCIGVSTGGPKALGELIPKLPSNYPLPILVVQHMPPLFTATMAKSLDSQSSLSVVEAADQMPVRAGTVYVAPGGKQMRVAGYSGAARIEITDDPPERSCKPSVNYLFQSVADLYGKATLALIMTGMGDDGLEGSRRLAGKGATIWAQDEATSTVYGMPRQIVDAGLASQVIPLQRLASELISVPVRPSAALRR